MVSKKKARKNADFKKVKLKVGKKLKKTATTDTTIKAKKVVLISQLHEKSDTSENPLSFRGLSLEELCKQLGHFNKTVRRDALLGTKQLLNSRPDLIETHLRTLIPSVARLVADCGHDPALNGQLRSLLRVICSVSSHAISAHFTLLVAHLLHALTHSEAGVRSFSLSIIALLLTNYPDLCRNSVDLFNTFVKFLNSSRKPAWNSPRFLETIELFIKAFTTNRSAHKTHCEEAKLDFSSKELSTSINLLRVLVNTNPFDFPVVNSCASRTVSPLESPESLLSLCEGCAPVIATSLSEDKAGTFLAPTVSILTQLGRAINNLSVNIPAENFAPRMSKIWAPVKKSQLELSLIASPSRNGYIFLRKSYNVYDGQDTSLDQAECSILEWPSRKLSNQFCTVTSDTMPFPDVVLMRRRNMVAASPDLRSYTERPRAKF